MYGRLLLLIFSQAVVEAVLPNVWFPIFMGFSGNGQSVYDYWFETTSTDDIPGEYFQFPRTTHLRGEFIDVWKNVSTIKVELFDKNKQVAWITFNGAGTTNANWFSKQNLLNSSFNDLTAASSVFNFFSMKGETRIPTLDRKFFISQSYGGCNNDVGWFVIADKYLACPWEKKGRKPVFLYTANNTPRNWNSDGRTADTLIISVLLNI